MRNCCRTFSLVVSLILLAGLAHATVITDLEVTGTGLDPAGAAIVPGAFDEDVDAFTDRTHEWNSAPGEVTIAQLALVGADYIMFANDDRSVADFNAAVTLGHEAAVFLFFDSRISDQPKPWMTALGFADTGYNIGVDEGGGGTGPGQSIENTSSIYLAFLPEGTYDFGPQAVGGTNMYGIAAVAVPEPASVALVGPGLSCLLARRRKPPKA